MDRADVIGIALDRFSRRIMRDHGVAIDMGEWTIVDISSIYESLVEMNRSGRSLSEEIMKRSECMIPPWSHAMLCSVHPDGSAVVMVDVKVRTPDAIEWDNLVEEEELIARDPMCQWVVDLGLHSTLDDEVKIAGAGALVGISESGRMMGSHVDCGETPPYVVGWMLSLAIATFNFMNCRNVELVEPMRSRPVRRRLERQGLRISEIVVLPTGKMRRSDGLPTPGSSPLTSVRGHFSEYGTNGKGLLFGKYAGRFWVPQHARGDAANGEVRQTFRLKADA